MRQLKDKNSIERNINREKSLFFYCSEGKVEQADIIDADGTN